MMLCAVCLPVLLIVFPFIFSTDWPQITSAALTLSGMTSHHEIPPALTITLKISSRGIDHLFKQISCSHCPVYLSLAEQLHAILNCPDKSKLTHILRVANMQPAWVHFKQHIGQAKCIVMDHKI
jgi:hypothetical protein